MTTIMRYMLFALVLVLLYFVGKTVYNDSIASANEAGTSVQIN